MFDATYEADLANYRDIAAHVGGFVYESGNGHIMWSLEAMSEEELKEHWDYVDRHAAEMSDDYQDYEYEPEYTLGAPRLNW